MAIVWLVTHGPPGDGGRAIYSRAEGGGGGVQPNRPLLQMARPNNAVLFYVPLRFLLSEYI